MSTANPIKAPLDTHAKLLRNPNDFPDPKMASVPYQSAIGALLYAACGSHPNIAFAT